MSGKKIIHEMFYCQSFIPVFVARHQRTGLASHLMARLLRAGGRPQCLCCPFTDIAFIISLDLFKLVFQSDFIWVGISWTEIRLDLNISRAEEGCTRMQMSS